MLINIITNINSSTGPIHIPIRRTILRQQALIIPLKMKHRRRDLAATAIAATHRQPYRRGRNTPIILRGRTSSNNSSSNSSSNRTHRNIIQDKDTMGDTKRQTTNIHMRRAAGEWFPCMPCRRPLAPTSSSGTNTKLPRHSIPQLHLHL
jgi:hypothetical protein